MGDEGERLASDSVTKTIREYVPEVMRIPSNEIVRPTEESSDGLKQPEASDEEQFLWLKAGDEVFVMASNLSGAEQNREDFDSKVQKHDVVASFGNSDNEQCCSCAHESVSLPKKQAQGSVDYEVIEPLGLKRDVKTNEILTQVLRIRFKSNPQSFFEALGIAPDKIDRDHPLEAILKLIIKADFNPLEVKLLEWNLPIFPKLISVGK